MENWREAIFLMLLLSFGVECAGQVGNEIKPPPLYDIKAESLYEAGLMHGKLASSRIRAWLASEEPKSLIDFVQGSGHEHFMELKRVNAAAFPQYVEEMRGIAVGANVPLDSIWCLNLIMELEALMPQKTGENHCSDFSFFNSQSASDMIGHAHNEDWSGTVKDYYYYVKYTALPGANFSSCAGLSYPGTLIGWAPTWNGHGVFLTQNTLYPRGPASRGLGTVFAQRDAICGSASSLGIDAIINHLIEGTWADGASINLIDLKTRRQANVERALGKHSILQITTSMGSYSHFNLYKHLGNHTDINEHDPSSTHRQARADSLAAPRSTSDLRDLLSDMNDTAYPIFRQSTIASLVLDGHGKLDVWCCGNIPSKVKPRYSWNLLNFFDDNVVLV